jgi:thioredoxin reductase/Pyruvate/2-oxoacid:ferredoxin oxidoreductase delta subunit
MNWILITGVSAFICVVFAVLGFWHRRIVSAEDRDLAEKIRRAEAEGSNQALTQHPQIDLNLCLGCGTCVLACPERGVLALQDGKARLVNASHCVGHGCCETACPVGALTVGLGDVSMRSDLPVLSDEYETTIPGVYIAGELGGIGLIRNAISQGTGIVETISNKLKRAPENWAPADRFDVLIVGSGPSGIAAALRAHELGLNFSIIDQDELGGTVRKYPRSKMTLTQPVDLPIYGKMNRTQYSKEELIELWEGVFENAGITVRSGVKFIGLERNADETLCVHTSAGVMECRACILALGRRGTPRRLNVPGEELETVLYQLSDAADYTGKNLLVVGGGDSAIEAALALAVQPGNEVTLSYRRHAFFRIKPRNRSGLDAAVQQGRLNVILNSQVEAIEPDRVVLQLNDEAGNQIGLQELSASHVFIFAGGEPPFPLLKNSGIRFGGPPDDSSLRRAG